MLNKIFLICCFFPFVSPYPIGSDTQPLAGVVAAIIVLRTLVKEREFNKNLLIILCVPILLLCYNNISSESLSLDFGKVLSLSFGALIIVGFFHSRECLTSKLFTTIVTIYFVVTILLLLFTAPMIELQNHVIRNTNASDFSYRGVAALATEPGLFGGLLVFFFIISDYLYENGKLTQKNKFIVNAMLFFMLLMTKSGTGYLYFILFFGLKYLLGEYRIKHKIIVLLASALTLISLIILIPTLEGSSLGRGASILHQLSDPKALQDDASISTRVVNMWLGLVSITHYPVGVGNAAALDAAKELMLVTPFVKNFYDVTGKDFGINSSFAYLTIAYGVIFWGYLLFLLSYFSKSHATWKCFALLYLSVSYSAAFPAIWILITLYVRSDAHATKNELNYFGRMVSQS